MFTESVNSCEIKDYKGVLKSRVLRDMGLNLLVYSHTKVNRNNTTIFNLPDMFRQTYAIFSCRSSLQFEYANYNDFDEN